MISEEQLAELELLAKAATPWTKKCWAPKAAGEGLCIKHPTKNEALIRVSWNNDNHDVNFILAANPERILSLIAEIRELRERLDRNAEHLTISINERVKLEREADWLARRLEDAEITIMQERQDAYMWREAAREAVNHEQG